MIHKEAFLSSMLAAIEEQRGKLEQLKEKAKDEYGETLADIHNAINDLEPKIVEAEDKAWEIADLADEKWVELSDSFEEGWDEAKKKFEEGWDNLTDSVKKLIS